MTYDEARSFHAPYPIPYLRKLWNTNIIGEQEDHGVACYVLCWILVLPIGNDLISIYHISNAISYKVKAGRRGYKAVHFSDLIYFTRNIRDMGQPDILPYITIANMC
jgi:hypothetical protein